MNILDIARKYLRQAKIDNPGPSPSPQASPTDCAESAESAESPPAESAPIPPTRYPSADPAKWGLSPGAWLAPDVDADALASPFLPENADLLRGLDEMIPPRRSRPI